MKYFDSILLSLLKLPLISYGAPTQQKSTDAYWSLRINIQMAPSWAVSSVLTLRRSVQEKAKCQDEFSKPGGLMGTRSWRPECEQPAV